MSNQATLERRRAARLAAAHAEEAGARRRRRLWQLAAATAAAAILVVTAAVVSASGGSAPPVPAAQQSSLFAGLRERAGVLGSPTAPVTLTEYLDLQCPVCARASRSTIPAVVRDYVRTGKVKLQARTLQFIGPDSVRAARVAAGAERQGRLWPFLETFYARQGQENSGYATDAFLRDTARAAGVDPRAALAVAPTAFATARLERANADASRAGVTGTPTLTVRRGNGPEQPLKADPLDAASVAAALDAELGR